MLTFYSRDKNMWSVSVRRMVNLALESMAFRRRRNTQVQSNSSETKNRKKKEEKKNGKKNWE